MKKKRFMGLLALASCVTLLTGCESDAFFGLGGKFNELIDWGKGLIGIKDEEKEQKEDTPSGEDKGSEGEDEDIQPIIPVITPSLHVDELPKYVAVGDAFSLDEYVTVFGASSVYTIELDSASSAIAEVDGHKIVVTGEGEISFSVKVDSLSEKCGFSAYYAERLALMKNFSDLGLNYTVWDLESDGSLSWSSAHNDNYIAFDNWDYDEATGPIGGGVVTFDASSGEGYVFYVEEGDEGLSTKVTNQIYSTYILETYNLPFVYDFSGIERVVEESEGEEEVSYSVFDREAYNFANNFLGSTGVYLYTTDDHTSEDAPYAKFDFVRLDFAADELTDGSKALIIYEYVDYHTQDELDALANGEVESLEENLEIVAIQVLTAQEEPLFEDLGAIAGKPEETPEGLDIALTFELVDFFETLNTFVNNPQIGAAASVNYGWYYPAQQSYVNIGSSNWEAWGLGNSIFTEFPSGHFYESLQSHFLVDFSYSNDGPQFIQGIASNTVEEVTTFYDVEKSETGELLAYARSDISSITDSEYYHFKDFESADYWAKDLFYDYSVSTEEYVDEETGETSERMVSAVLYMNKYRQDKVFETLSSAFGLDKFYDFLAYYEAFDIFDSYIYVDAEGMLKFHFESDYLSNYGLPFIYQFEVTVGYGASFAENVSDFYNSLSFN